jgi:flavin reductase (DIM6/NTAB) family NADH-FMN oxidoreductase RutF
VQRAERELEHASGRDPTDGAWMRQVLGQYPTGVCAITACERDGAPTGFVVGSFTSVSLSPPLVAFFADESSTSWPKIERARSFCVNILGADHEQLCRRFAAKNVDRFEGVSWRPAATGSPILQGVVAWIDCELESVLDAGDHHIAIGRVRELDVEESGLPLLFFQGGYGRFTPLSLAVGNVQGLLTKQLREVDVVRPELERLASELSARCIAIAPVEEQLIVVASAGAANSSAAATLVGLRLPFAQPTGAPFASWMDEQELRRYLAGTADDEARELHRERLRRVRERGFSVGMAGDAERTFGTVLDSLAEDPEALSHDDLRGLVDELVYDPVELTAEAKREIRSIAVPVFDSNGAVTLAITLYGFPKPGSEREIDDWIERCTSAARVASEHLAASG